MGVGGVIGALLGWHGLLGWCVFLGNFQLLLLTVRYGLQVASRVGYAISEVDSDASVVCLSAKSCHAI